ncbi:MAG: enoyl-CoA hydratase/isomerase family protein, partial [Actinomycetota bacterium]
RAADMVLTGASMVATEAKAAGLVQRIAAPDDLEPALERWLSSDFLPRSASGLRYAAQASRLPLLHALDYQLPALEERYLNGLMQQPEAVEGLLAFLEKRQPRWNIGPAA